MTIHAPPARSHTWPRRLPFAGRQRSGISAFEFVTCVLLLLVIVVATVEVGRVYMIRHASDNAAYRAARHAVVPGASAAEAVTRAKELLRAAGVGDGQIVVTPNPITESTTSVTVDIRIPLGSNAWFVHYLARGHQIDSTATLLTERPPTVSADAVPHRPGTAEVPTQETPSAANSVSPDETVTPLALEVPLADQPYAGQPAEAVLGSPVENRSDASPTTGDDDDGVADPHPSERDPSQPPAAPELPPLPQL